MLRISGPAVASYPRLSWRPVAASIPAVELRRGELGVITVTALGSVEELDVIED